MSYGYDNASICTSVTDFNNHQIAITPNADGLTATISLGATGDTINTTYDNTDTPSAITLKNTSSTLQSFTYSDAPSGNILNETDTPTSSQSPAVYTYDAKGRVTSMTPGTGSPLNYAFDPSSNLTTLPTGASTSYDKAGELTSSTLAGTATSYTYNADGERLTAAQGSTTIASGTWNGARELTAYSDPAANMTAATYDGIGLRATSTITPSSGTAATQAFIWDNRGQVPLLLMDSTNAYVYDGSGTPAEQVNLSTGATTYLDTDLIGSVRGIVSAAGSLTATTAYDAWGNPESTGGLTSYTPFGFAGAYTDSTGLIYLVDRYYDPVTGQFISVDPEVAQTQEPYAYVSGNPVESTDPTGASETFGNRLGGEPCHDLHAWCMSMWEDVFSLTATGPHVWSLEKLDLIINPGAKVSRVDYHAIYRTHGPGYQSFLLSGTMQCFGVPSRPCGSNAIALPTKGNKSGSFTIKNTMAMNGMKFSHMMELTGDCAECINGPQIIVKFYTGMAHCEDGYNTCHYHPVDGDDK